MNFFRSKGVREGVIDAIRNNELTGELFLELTDTDFKELASSLADRLLLRKIQANLISGSNTSAGSMVDKPLQDVNVVVVQQPLVEDKDESDESWLPGFKIPTKFSSKTMECVSSGILTQSSRTEIVQTLATLMWLHTRLPSREAYNTICAKLVKIYPTLADDAGDGQANYLSWKQKLRDRFKFLRRPPSGHGSSPKAAKRRRYGSVTDEKDTLTEDEHKKYVKEMAQEMTKRKKRSTLLCENMAYTFNIRQKWIQTDQPPVIEILETYPALKYGKTLKQEFRTLLKLEGQLNSLLENWEVWSERIIQYAGVEATNRKNVTELLAVYDSLGSNDKEEKVGVIILKLLCELFIARKRETETIIHSLSNTCDLEQELRAIKKITPYLVVIDNTETTTFVTVVEKEVLITTENFRSAVLYLIGAYYTFNISYPQLVYPVLIFIQRYVMGIEDSQVVPKCIRQAVTVMKRFK